MACPRCILRYLVPRPRKTPSQHQTRTFSTSPSHSRLGAFTYAQEWQTGTYHYNKAHTASYPVATARTDELLQNWFTSFHRRQNTTPDQQTPQTTPDGKLSQAQLLKRNAVIAQRRLTDRVHVSHATAKDYGDRVAVTAYVFDQVEAADAAREKLRLRRLGLSNKDGSGQGGQAARRGRPVVARGGAGQGFGSGIGGAVGSGANRGGAGFRGRGGGFGGVRRGGGMMGRGGGVGMKRLPLGGAGKGEGSRFSRPGGGVPRSPSPAAR